jgi:hypothetical protein
MARITIGAAAGLLSLACSGGSLDNSGTGGTGGTGGAVRLELPDCVQALVAACPANALGCIVESTDGGFGAEICYPSGVRATLSGIVESTGSGPRVVQVTKADGSPCYSMETSLFGGEVYRYLWKDAGGQTVATGSYDPFGNPTHTISCAGGGQTRSCHSPPSPPTGACCSLNELGNGTCGASLPCVAGTCP